MYWPECSCTLSTGNFDVSSESEKSLGEIVKRTFIMKNSQTEVNINQILDEHNHVEFALFNFNVLPECLCSG